MPDAVRHLLAPDEVQALLRLEASDVSQLERTGQLTQLLICGKPRYDSKDVVALIETYKTIAFRRAKHE